MRNTVLLQTFAALWVLGFAMVLHVAFQPFRYRITGLLDLSSIGATFFTFLAGLVFYENTVEGGSAIPIALQTLLLIFVILINTFVLTFGLVMLFMDRYIEELVYLASTSNRRSMQMLLPVLMWIQDGFTPLDATVLNKKGIKLSSSSRRDLTFDVDQTIATDATSMRIASAFTTDRQRASMPGIATLNRRTNASSPKTTNGSTGKSNNNDDDEDNHHNNRNSMQRESFHNPAYNSTNGADGNSGVQNNNPDTIELSTL